MADEDKTKVPKPAPASSDQTSSGPAVDTQSATENNNGGDNSEPESKTYYLRSGAKHTVLERGEPRKLTQPGEKVVLTAAQYNSFKDKFLTAEEFKQVKNGKGDDAIADGPTAADTLLEATLEQATIEEHNAVNNDAATGKNATNTVGEKSASASTPSKSSGGNK